MKVADQLRRAVLKAQLADCGEYRIGPYFPVPPSEPAPTKFMGLEVRTSPLCTRTVPVRQHKDRGCVVRVRFFNCLRKPSPYHIRVQKKWNKRFGFKEEKYMMVIGRNVVLVHPETLQMLTMEMSEFQAVLR
jgi:hypothetical protein